MNMLIFVRVIFIFIPLIVANEKVNLYEENEEMFMYDKEGAVKRSEIEESPKTLFEKRYMITPDSAKAKWQDSLVKGSQYQAYINHRSFIPDASNYDEDEEYEEEYNARSNISPEGSGTLVRSDLFFNDKEAQESVKDASNVADVEDFNLTASQCINNYSYGDVIFMPVYIEANGDDKEGKSNNDDKYIASSTFTCFKCPDDKPEKQDKQDSNNNNNNNNNNNVTTTEYAHKEADYKQTLVCKNVEKLIINDSSKRDFISESECPSACNLFDKKTQINSENTNKALSETWFWKQLNPALSYHQIARSSVGILVDSSFVNSNTNDIIRKFSFNLMNLFSRDSKVALAHFGSCIGYLDLDSEPMIDDKTNNEFVNGKTMSAFNENGLLSKNLVKKLGLVGSHSLEESVVDILQKISDNAKNISTEMKVLFLILGDATKKSYVESKIKDLARNSNIKVYIIQLGNQYEKCQLQSITTPERVYITNHIHHLLFGGYVKSRNGKEAENSIWSGILLNIYNRLMLLNQKYDSVYYGNGFVGFKTDAGTKYEKKNEKSAPLKDISKRADVPNVENVAKEYKKKGLRPLEKFKLAAKNRNFDPSFYNQLENTWLWEKTIPEWGTNSKKPISAVFITDVMGRRNLEMTEKLVHNIIRMFPLGVSKHSIIGLKTLKKYNLVTKKVYTTVEDIQKDVTTLRHGIGKFLQLSKVFYEILTPGDHKYFNHGDKKAVFIILRHPVLDFLLYKYIGRMFDARNIKVYILALGPAYQASYFNELTPPSRVFTSPLFRTFFNKPNLMRLNNQLNNDFGTSNGLTVLYERPGISLPLQSMKKAGSKIKKGLSALGNKIRGRKDRNEKRDEINEIEKRQGIKKVFSAANAIKMINKLKNQFKGSSLSSVPGAQVDSVGPANLAFMIDNSLREARLDRLKRIIKKVILAFPLKNTHITLMTFSGEIYYASKLSIFKEEIAIDRALSLIKIDRNDKKRVFLGQALYDVNKHFVRGEPGLPNLVFLFMNSISEDDYRLPALELSKNGIRVISITTGRQVPLEQSKLTSTNAHLSFSMVHTLIKTDHHANILITASKSICGATTRQMSSFIHDSSITNYNWIWRVYGRKNYYRSIEESQLGFVMDVMANSNSILKLALNLIMSHSRTSSTIFRILAEGGGPNLNVLEKFHYYSDSSSLIFLLQTLFKPDLNKVSYNERLKRNENTTNRNGTRPSGNKRRPTRRNKRDTVLNTNEDLKNDEVLLSDLKNINKRFILKNTNSANSVKHSNVFGHGEQSKFTYDHMLNMFDLGYNRKNAESKKNTEELHKKSDTTKNIDEPNDRKLKRSTFANVFNILNDRKARIVNSNRNNMLNNDISYNGDSYDVANHRSVLNVANQLNSLNRVMKEKYVSFKRIIYLLLGDEPVYSSTVEHEDNEFRKVCGALKQKNIDIMILMGKDKIRKRMKELLESCGVLITKSNYISLLNDALDTAIKNVGHIVTNTYSIDFFNEYEQIKPMVSFPASKPVFPSAVDTFLSTHYLYSVQHMEQQREYSKMIVDIEQQAVKGAGINAVLLVDLCRSSYFEIYKTLIANLINTFNLDTTRFTLVPYHEKRLANLFVNKKFNDFNEIHNFIAHHLNRPVSVNRNHLDDVLDYVDRHLVQDLDKEPRQTVVVVVSTKPSKGTPAVTALRLKNRGIMVMCMGVGHSYNAAQLGQIASSYELNVAGPDSILPTMLFRMQFAATASMNSPKSPARRLGMNNISIYRLSKTVYRPLLTHMSQKVISKGQQTFERPEYKSETKTN